MKKLLCILTFALFSVSAYAGIFRLSAKAVESSAKLGYKATSPARHPKKSAQKTLHAAKKSGKAALKIAY